MNDKLLVEDGNYRRWDVDCNSYESEYYKLAHDMLDDMSENINEIFESDPYDAAHEYADGWTPIITHKIISVFASDSVLWHRETDDHDISHDDDRSISRQCQLAIYDALHQEATDWIMKQEEANEMEDARTA